MRRLSDYLEEAKRFGIERFVFVQPSAYGRDNACMLDAMREVGPERCRGIVDIDENASDAALERLNAAGVRGVRINVNPIKPLEPGFSKNLLPRIARLDASCAELGWMLDFLTPGWLTRELMPTMARLKSPYSLAHMGMFLAKEGVPHDFVAFVKDNAEMLGEAHRRVSHVHRAGLRRRGADRAALIAAAPRARDLGKRLSAPVVRRPGAHRRAVRRCWRRGRPTSARGA